MTYPDGEVVNHNCDAGGCLFSLVRTVTYVGETTYNELSLLTQMKFNSASSPLRVTSYEYYPSNYRLRWIRSGPPGAPKSEQKLEYSYDNVGSVLFCE